MKGILCNYRYGMLALTEPQNLVRSPAGVGLSVEISSVGPSYQRIWFDRLTKLPTPVNKIRHV